MVAAIAGITVVAATTDRDVRLAEALTFGAALILGSIAGLSVVRYRRRRHRWRLEREDVNGNGPE